MVRNRPSCPGKRVWLSTSTRPNSKPSTAIATPSQPPDRSRALTSLRLRSRQIISAASSGTSGP